MNRLLNGLVSVGFISFLGGVLALLGMLLPYVLPLGGPVTLPPDELADANGRFVTVSGETLYYTHSPGSGPAVLLLHGFGGSTVSWRETVPALAAAGYDVYAVDLLGFGLSDKGWRHDYSHAAQATRVLDLLDVLAIEQATIVGHSMGGNVAARVALQAPARVDRLVLVSPAILGDGDAPLPADAFALLELPPLRRWSRIALRATVAPRFDSLLLSAAARQDAITPDVRDGYRRVLHTPDWDLALLAMTRDAANNAVGEAVRGIDRPTLLVWGTDDSWVPVAAAAELESLLPSVQRVDFDGVGHLPMHEAPGHFQAALLAFLAGGDVQIMP